MEASEMKIEYMPQDGWYTVARIVRWSMVRPVTPSYCATNARVHHV